MGLRNGKLINLLGSNPDLTDNESSLSPSLLSFNPLPPTIQPTVKTNHVHLNNNTNFNNNNNNNAFDLNVLFTPIVITNHPSLDPLDYFPTKLDILLDRPAVSREQQFDYGWNHEDRSMNIFVKQNDPCTFHRHVRFLNSKRQREIQILLFFSLLLKVPMLSDRKKAFPRVYTFGRSNGRLI